MSSLRQESGFSLAEVIVAFAILSIALVAIFKSYGLVAHGTAHSEREHKALGIARSLLAMTGVTDRLRQVSDTGILTDGTTWMRNVTPYGDAISPNMLRSYLVTVEVGVPGSKQRQSLVSLSTIKLAPVP